MLHIEDQATRRPSRLLRFARNDNRRRLSLRGGRRPTKQSRADYVPRVRTRRLGELTPRRRAPISEPSPCARFLALPSPFRGSHDRRLSPAAVRLRQRSLRQKPSAPRRRRSTSWSRSSAALSDEALRARTADFKQRLADGESSTISCVEPSPPCARRPSARSGQRHFDVQLMGGIVLHRGMIAEMKTGEGKTLVATLPVYLNALPARASMSSPSTTTWPSATASGWARSTASSA